MTDAAPPQEQHISLFYQEGSSDKEYRLHLVAKDAGWVVNYEYGKRCKALRSGTKTEAAVAFNVAQACYDKALKGQLKDGYTPTEGGVAYQDTERAGCYTGIVPQLLNAIGDVSAEAWIKDPEAFGQEKYNGERRLVKADGEGITGINRSALSIAVSKPFETAALAVPAKTWIADGEDMGTYIRVFDLLEIDGEDLRGKDAGYRLARMERLFASNPIFRPIQTARTEAEKRALFARVKSANGEGVVFKKTHAPYTSGRPASGGDQVKFKFVEPAIVRVCKGRSTKRSVGIEAMDAQGAWVRVGNVTVPPSVEVPGEGELLEVGYLYAYVGGSLYQPTFDRVRTDLTEAACTLAQLKYKPANEDDELVIKGGGWAEKKRAKP